MNVRFHRHVPGLAATLVTAALALSVGPAATTAAAQSPAELRTAAEESGFDRHTRHAELLEYMRAVRDRSPDMRLGSYGETYEGRELPYAIFSRPSITQPWEAVASGKPVVVLAANVHGNERTLRESLLLLTRELATPGTEANAMLDDLVILVAPTINPDGFEASERGTRGNAFGIDLNRDYVKLEHPSIINYIGNLIRPWSPHIFVDGHNGGSYPYNLNYQCTSNGGADVRLTLICDDEIFPLIDRRMLENGFESWYYTRGTETRWNGGSSEVRIGRNYGGLANSVAILFESPGGQTLQTGALAGVVGYKAVLEYARDNAQRLIATVDSARMETAAFGDGAWDELMIQQEYGPEPYTVNYKIAVGEDREIVEVESDSLMKRPIPTLVRERPYAYILPREAVDAIDLVGRHGITVDILEDELTLPVQAYTLADVEYERAYNHDAATRVTVGDVVTVERTFPAGSFVIRTDQVLGRLAMHMLEPESPDNIVYWNTMDAWLPKAALERAQTAQASSGDGAEAGTGTAPASAPAGLAQEDEPLIPIFKLMDRRALPTRILE